MNGWRNRATWLVNLWFQPECKGDVDYLEDTLQHDFEEQVKNWTGNGWHAGFYSDLIDFTAIDWDELREAMPTEEE